MFKMPDALARYVQGARCPCVQLSGVQLSGVPHGAIKTDFPKKAFNFTRSHALHLSANKSRLYQRTKAEYFRAPRINITEDKYNGNAWDFLVFRALEALSG